MAIDDMKLISFSTTYPILDLETKKQVPELFDFLLFCIIAEEAKRGVIPEKVGKSRREGTQIKYRAANKGELEQFWNQILKQVEDAGEILKEKIQRVIDNERDN